MSATPSDAERIARGGQPTPWSKTFTHPVHGELTFTGALPSALTMAEHSIAMDNLLDKLDGEPRGGTMLLVAAIAGLQQLPDAPGRSLLVQLPCIREDREDDDESGSVKVTRVFYDATGELHSSFLIEVWTDFSLWRQALLQEVASVKGSSGATGGNGSSTPSAAPTGSPSTTPA